MQENNIKLLKIGTDTTLTHDVSEEFSLPDYIPEIRRVLGVATDVLPESKYTQEVENGATLEFGGSVTYSLMYVDDEGELCALPLSSNYEAKTSLVNDVKMTFIDTTVENSTCRVNGPRRVTLKARLKSRVLDLIEKKLEENITPKSSADEMFIQRKTKEINSVNLDTCSLQNIRINEKFDLGGIKEIKPIWCTARIDIKDARANNSSISTRGEITVKCLTQADGEIKMLTRVVPLVEEVECEGVKSDDIIRISGRCISLSLSNEENEEGNQLFFDLTCELEGEAVRNNTYTVTEDAYSTKCNMDASYKNELVYEALRGGESSFTLNEGVKRKGQEIEEIIEIICDPVYEKSETKGTKVSLLGKVNALVLGKTKADENGQCQFASESYEIPFKYELDAIKAPQMPVVRCIAKIGEADGRYDKDSFFINGEISLSYLIFNGHEEKLFEGGVLKNDEEIKKDASSVRIYFPKEGEGLWEIAKKYHTTTTQIRKDNDLNDSESVEKKSLIV